MLARPRQHLLHVPAWGPGRLGRNRPRHRGLGKEDNSILEMVWLVTGDVMMVPWSPLAGSRGAAGDARAPWSRAIRRQHWPAVARARERGGRRAGPVGGVSILPEENHADSDLGPAAPGGRPVLASLDLCLAGQRMLPGAPGARGNRTQGPLSPRPAAWPWRGGTAPGCLAPGLALSSKIDLSRGFRNFLLKLILVFFF